MNGTTIVRALAVVLLAAPIVARAQAPTLTGAWTRISLRDPSGHSIQPPQAPAFVIFSADGFYSQSAIPENRPKLDKALADMTKEELLVRFYNVEAWRGTYTLIGNRLSRKSVTDINPEGEGTEFLQVVRFARDTLVLTLPDPASRFEARFVRARQPRR